MASPLYSFGVEPASAILCIICTVVNHYTAMMPTNSARKDGKVRSLNTLGGGSCLFMVAQESVLVVSPPGSVFICSCSY